jgi:hypothetical protein
LRKSAFHKIWQSIYVVPNGSTINAVMRLCSQEVCSWSIGETCEIKTPLGDEPKSGCYDETVHMLKAMQLIYEIQWNLWNKDTFSLRTRVKDQMRCPYCHRMSSDFCSGAFHRFHCTCTW